MNPAVRTRGSLGGSERKADPSIKTQRPVSKPPCNDPGLSLACPLPGSGIPSHFKHQCSARSLQILLFATRGTSCPSSEAWHSSPQMRGRAGQALGAVRVGRTGGWLLRANSVYPVKHVTLKYVTLLPGNGWDLGSNIQDRHWVTSQPPLPLLQPVL